MHDVILCQTLAGVYELTSTRLPLPCLSIAAMLDRDGYNVKIIDQRINQNWRSYLIESLKNNPICAGITSMTGPQIGFALEVSRCVKDNSDVPVVWGGVHPSLLPVQTLENENIDVVVVGEGEETFYELVLALEKGQDLKNVKGIYYKQDGKIKNTPERPFLDLNDLPDMPYHLVDIKKYSAFDLSGTGEQALSVMTSRGCPYGCSFCYNTVFNKRKWRALTVENSLDRIKRIVDDFGVHSIYFPEDNFSFNLERFEGIIKGIIEEGLDITWGSQGIRMDSVGKISHELLGLAEKSGCKNLDIGIESGSPRILKLINKGTTVKEIAAGGRKLAKHDFIVKYNFMMGIPTETMSERKESVVLGSKLIKENPKAYMLYHIYTPFPQTELYKLACESGFKPPDTLEKWAAFNYLDWTNHYDSWLSEKDVKDLGDLAFISRLANKNIMYKITNPLIKTLFGLYYPFAKFRLDHNFYFCFVEKPLEGMMRPLLLKYMGRIGKKY